jgi:SAM-dependent methyltransferase
MKDRFSSYAGQYAAFRPTYPGELYNFIFNQLDHFTTAWDAGTGNGQVARDLAGKFTRVMATDISPQQLKNAYPAANIFYSQTAAERTSFPDKTFDLITVAQAIHWFDLNQFYAEVTRVAKPGALLAVWGYGLLSIGPEIDSHLHHFYTAVVGPYWDNERRLIDEHYRTLSFPFDEIESPAFQFSVRWTLDEFQGYLATWSSVQKYQAEKGLNPVESFIDEVRPAWKEEIQTVNFPLFLRLGRIGE